MLYIFVLTKDDIHQPLIFVNMSIVVVVNLAYVVVVHPLVLEYQWDDFRCLNVEIRIYRG